jgi:hypothetical protein
MPAVGGRIEKAAGKVPAACRARNCLLSKIAPSAPVYETCIGERTKRNQNCCTVKGTNELSWWGHTAPGCWSRFKLSLAPMRLFAIVIECPLDVPVQRPYHADCRRILRGNSSGQGKDV